MEDTCIFIADKTIINYLLSGEQDKIVKAQLLLDYLSWRRCNKKIYFTPSTFKTIRTRLNEEADKSIVAYFDNWFENGADLIGEDATTEEQDILSLYETLQKINPIVFVISDSLNIEGLAMMDMEKLKTYLNDKRDFYNHIFLTYYDTSSV